jgi:hypothetical protein
MALHQIRARTTDRPFIRRSQNCGAVAPIWTAVPLLSICILRVIVVPHSELFAPPDGMFWIFKLRRSSRRGRACRLLLALFRSNAAASTCIAWGASYASQTALLSRLCCTERRRAVSRVNLCPLTFSRY